jgi:hypothetical protein
MVTIEVAHEALVSFISLPHCLANPFYKFKDADLHV